MFYDAWDTDLIAALEEPFPVEAHKVKVQGGSEITFVDVHKYKERLNATVGPHGWSNTLRLEPIGGKLIATVALTVLGVTKENVGDEVEVPEVNERGNEKIIGGPATNSYAQAFKRACSDFGLGSYLYDREKREAASRGVTRQSNGASPRTANTPPCPKCGGPTWDNRAKKASGEYKDTAPDFACKGKSCDGKIWPEKEEATAGELDRLFATVQIVVNDIASLDLDQGKGAQKLLDDLLKVDGVGVKHINELGGKLQARLKKLQEEAVPVPSYDDPPPAFPADLPDLPF